MLDSIRVYIFDDVAILVPNVVHYFVADAILPVVQDIGSVELAAHHRLIPQFFI